MKALTKSKAEPGLWLEEVPEPVIGLNDVLIRVDRTGICGTDLHIWRGDSELARMGVGYPIILGHETVGRVARLGKGAGKDALGRSLVPHALGLIVLAGAFEGVFALHIGVSCQSPPKKIWCTSG